MDPLDSSLVLRIERELEVIIPAEAIQQRVAELAQELRDHTAGERLVAVAALSGGFMFFADLVRMIVPSPVVDFVRLQSYRNSMEPSQPVGLLTDIRHPLTDQHVLIVEDIVDTGHTALFLIELVKRCRPAAMTFVSLLDKKARRKVGVSADLVGFEIDDRFVVGYGLDYAGHFRGLPDVCVMPSWVEEELGGR